MPLSLTRFFRAFIIAPFLGKRAKKDGRERTDQKKKLSGSWQKRIFLIDKKRNNKTLSGKKFRNATFKICGNYLRLNSQIKQGVQNHWQKLSLQ